MAEGEHLSEQTRHLWLAEKSTPLPGTEKHPQGRLFAPIGGYAGDPWKLAPENWLKQGDSPAHEDIISWHGSEESSLPRTDEYEHRALESEYDPSWASGADWDPDWDAADSTPGEDYTTDTKDRPMSEYGSSVGMHFGDIAASTARGNRPFIHPARIPQETLVDPPPGAFSTPKVGGAIVSGFHKSERKIVNKETGEVTPDTRWSDPAANYSEKATDLVEKGKTLAYRNDVEAPGSTSYRALPETARTWSEDVMSAKRPDNRGVASKYGWHSDPHAFRNTPHPALVHLAEKGYDPVVLRADTPKPVGFEPMQMSFGDLADEDYRVINKLRQREQPRVDERRAAFNAGRDWSLQKPTD